VAYQLPVLGYEPYIDAETMRLHHDKHQQPYIDQLNKAVATYSRFDRTTVEDSSLISMMCRKKLVPSSAIAAADMFGTMYCCHPRFLKTNDPISQSQYSGLNRG
jgi:superoxide dismutase